MNWFIRWWILEASNRLIIRSQGESRVLPSSTPGSLSCQQQQVPCRACRFHLLTGSFPLLEGSNTQLNDVRTYVVFQFVCGSISFLLLLIRSCLCVCVRQTIERRGSQFAQDRKRSSQDQQHGWSKENVRKVASLQSVVSCCGSYPFFFKLPTSPLLVHFLPLPSLHSSLMSIDQDI